MSAVPRSNMRDLERSRAVFAKEMIAVDEFAYRIDAALPLHLEAAKAPLPTADLLKPALPKVAAHVPRR
eukprot:SAG11_NODE_6434_length_1314_cov_1.483128_2_plen_69_part_00